MSKLLNQISTIKYGFSADRNLDILLGEKVQDWLGYDLVICFT